MALHPDFCLLVKNGQLLACDVSGQQRPISMTIKDLSLLISDEVEDKYLNRMHFLKGSGLYTSDIYGVKGPRSKLSEIERSEPFDVQPVSVNMNFSVIGEGNKWLIWSSKRQQWIVCSIDELTVLLIAVFDFNAILNESNDKLKEKKVNYLEKFINLGILNYSRTNPHSEQKEKTENNKLKNSNKKILWQEMPVEHKIPVYFFPHMQNHYPLALGVLFSAISDHNDGELLNTFQLVPITYMEPQDFLKGPYTKFKEGVWLFSNYMWSVDLNLQISEAIKKHSNKNLTIHGGPSTPEYPQACTDFMNQFKSVDIAVHGEGEVSIVEIFKRIIKTGDGNITIDSSLDEVDGITFRDMDAQLELVRTTTRKRTATPDSVPSPYLLGHFDQYGVSVEAAILESNRGCPFGCTFCDWGSATNQKVRKFDLDRVKEEIDWIANQQVRVLWLADANYGLYDRDIELAQYIVDSKQKTGFPQEVVVNYTKNSTWRLVEIIKIFTAGGIISQGIISIQTTDEKTLEVINRKNIKTEKYDELTKVFYDLKLPLSTDLMMGLPGSTVEGFNKDLQRYIDMDVSVKAYPTQLLPNSPMADPEYIKKYQIKTDENDFLISSFSFTEQDLLWMKGLYHVYTVADGYGLLRYVIRYLQWEHNITAVEFLSDILQHTNDFPAKYKKITWALRYFVTDKCMPGGWDSFYQEVNSYIKEKYGISDDPGLKVVLEVSNMSMPDDGLKYPIQKRLEHDFSAYFVNRSKGEKDVGFPLTHYPPAQFIVSDPNNMSSIDMDYMQYDSHQYFWELHSEVARPKSTSEFAEGAS